MAIPYSSSYDETIPFSDTTFRLALTVGIAQTVTIPGTSDQKFNVLFGCSSNANNFVGYNTTATVPPGGTTVAGQGVEFIIPGDKRYVKGGDTLSVVTGDATSFLGISVRKIPN